MAGPHDEDARIDAALARRIVAGDHAAEAELCRRMLPRVRVWGLRHLRDEAAALDLGQHAMIVVLEALRADRVTEIDRLGAYVLGVCKHTMMALRRGEHRRRGLLERFGAALQGEAAIEARAIERRHLAKCFEELPGRARTLLALMFFADEPAEVIARELATTAGNVRVLRHRALVDLQRCMEACA